MEMPTAVERPRHLTGDGEKVHELASERRTGEQGLFRGNQRKSDLKSSPPATLVR